MQKLVVLSTFGMRILYSAYIFVAHQPADSTILMQDFCLSDSVQCCIEPWLLWITIRIRYPIDACHFLWPLKAARERSSFFLHVYVMLVPFDQQRLVSILPHVGKGLLKKCQLHTPSQGLCLATLQSLEPLPKPTPFHLERPNLVQYAQSV